MTTVYEKIIELFGEYQPIIVELADGTQQVAVNWAYVGGIAIFGIATFCILKILGGVLKK